MSNNNLMVNGRLNGGSSAPSVHSKWPPPRRMLPQRQSSLPTAPIGHAYQMHLKPLQGPPPAGSLRHMSNSSLSNSGSRLLLNSSR